MKSVKTYAGIAFLTFAMASCSQDEPAFTPVEPGTEIQFGIALSPDNPQKTRTYYQDYNSGANEWKVYWNNSGNRDHIFVYSPQAASGRNQASYTVNADQKYQENAASVTKDGAYGVQTGAASTGYDFYGIYPASAVKGTAENNTINATLNGSQKATFTGTNASQAPDVNEVAIPKASTGGGEYYTKPDMTQALLTCKESNVTLDANTPVSLQFKPFATCLDIVINGPETTTTTSARVTSVIIESNAAISGDFSYDFADNGKFTATGTNSNSVNIDTKGTDEVGNIVGVPLSNGDVLHVQGFILPNPAITSLKVTVVLDDARIFRKTLTINNNSPLKPGQIHTVNLPKLNLNEVEFDYSIWLSQLDPNIYISEISLPGASAAFTSVLSNDNLNKQQTKSLTDLFDAGIRVFQSHINLVNQQSSVDGGATSIGISAVGNPVMVNGRYFTLSDVIQTLTTEMASTHADEFCVLLLSDYGVTDYKAFYSRLKTILDSDLMKNLVVTNFGPNTTIRDIKGKVLVKFAPNANNTTTAEMEPLNGANALFNIWTQSSSSQVNYSTLEWGTTAGLKNSDRPISPEPKMLFIHNENANPVKWSSAASNNYTWNTNASSQISAYYSRYNSDSHNIFGMSYLGGAGSTHSYWSIIGGTQVKTVTPTEVADHYNNEIWMNAVKSNTTKPYGWVVVNMVGIESTNNVIAKVISRNSEIALKKKSTDNTSPNGDVGGSPNGGKLF